MPSVHNVKRVKRNKLGIIPGKPGEHKLQKIIEPNILAVCVICGHQWRTIFNFARCCSLKCRNKYQYLKNREKRIEFQKKYYFDNKNKINEYKHTQKAIEARRKQQRWENLSQEQIKKIKKRQKKYQRLHLDKFREYNLKYYYKNRDRARALT